MPRWVSRACVAIVWLAIAAEIAAAFDLLENPWPSVALQLLSSAAIGLDAVAIGVRRRVGVGMSIANLAPGGWAIFAGMMWILAVPAYFFGARRRALRGDLADVEVEPVRWGSWAAIGTLAALSALALLAGIAAGEAMR